MLHVDGGEDIDAGIQQFLHVLPAFGVTRTANIAVRQFVDQDDCRATCQCPIQIKLMMMATVVADLLHRQGGQAFH